MKLTSLVILVMLALAALAAPGARAEVVVVSGVELRLPPEWGRSDKGPATLLGPKKFKGRAIEVIELKAMPTASPDAFGALLGSEQLDLAQVKEIDRDNAKAIIASGKLTTSKGQIAVDLLVIPVQGKATMLISFVGVDQDPVIRKDNRAILDSARVPGPRVTLAFHAPKTAGMVVPPKPVVEAITVAAEEFDKHVRFPRPLPIMFEECGEVNSYYSPGQHRVRMCHDLYDDTLKMFTGVGLDPAKAELMAGYVFVFVFFHEFGHALVGELGLPITGNGEAAADEIATLILAQGAKTQRIALGGAAWFDAQSRKPGHKMRYWTTHPFDRVRFETIVCLLYGTDKAAYAELTKQLKVPATRLARCESDAHKRFAAWKSLLAPHAVKP